MSNSCIQRFYSMGSPLHHAAKEYRKNVLLLADLVLKYEMEINKPNRNSNTPLTLLVRNPYVNAKSLQALLSSKHINVSLAPKHQQTALSILCMKNYFDYDMINLLLTKDSKSIDTLDYFGYTALGYVCKSSKITYEILHLMIVKYSANINVFSEHTHSPFKLLCMNTKTTSDMLMLFVQHSNFTEVDALVELSTNVNFNEKLFESVVVLKPNYQHAYHKIFSNVCKNPNLKLSLYSYCRQLLRFLIMSNRIPNITLQQIQKDFIRLCYNEKVNADILELYISEFAIDMNFEILVIDICNEPLTPLLAICIDKVFTYHKLNYEKIKFVMSSFNFDPTFQNQAYNSLLSASKHPSLTPDILRIFMQDKQIFDILLQWNIHNSDLLLSSLRKIWNGMNAIRYCDIINLNLDYLVKLYTKEELLVGLHKGFVRVHAIHINELYSESTCMPNSDIILSSN